MTCLVGLKTEEGVWIGADSCQSSHSLILPSAQAGKVFSVGEFLFGFSGGVRGKDIVKHAFAPPERSECETLEHYIYVSFINTLRVLLKDSGASEKHNEREEQGNNIIFAYRGRLFALYTNYSVIEYNDYIADGSGVEVALGSLFTSVMERSSEKRVKTAIRAAVKFNAYVEEPILVQFQPCEHDSNIP